MPNQNNRATTENDPMHDVLHSAEIAAKSAAETLHHVHTAGAHLAAKNLNRVSTAFELFSGAHEISESDEKINTAAHLAARMTGAEVGAEVGSMIGVPLAAATASTGFLAPAAPFVFAGSVAAGITTGDYIGDKTWEFFDSNLDHAAIPEDQRYVGAFMQQIAPQIPLVNHYIRTLADNILSTEKQAKLRSIISEKVMNAFHETLTEHSHQEKSSLSTKNEINLLYWMAEKYGPYLRTVNLQTIHLMADATRLHVKPTDHDAKIKLDRVSQKTSQLQITPDKISGALKKIFKESTDLESFLLAIKEHAGHFSEADQLLLHNAELFSHYQNTTFLEAQLTTLKQTHNAVTRNRIIASLNAAGEFGNNMGRLLESFGCDDLSKGFSAVGIGLQSISEFSKLTLQISDGINTFSDGLQAILSINNLIGFAANIVGLFKKKSDSSVKIMQALQFIFNYIAREFQELKQFLTGFRKELYERLSLYFDEIIQELNHVKSHGNFHAGLMHAGIDSLLDFSQKNILAQAKRYSDDPTLLEKLSAERLLELLPQLETVIEASSEAYQSGYALCDSQRASGIATDQVISEIFRDRGKLFGYIAACIATEKTPMINPYIWQASVLAYLPLLISPRSHAELDRNLEKLKLFAYQGELFLNFTKQVQSKLLLQTLFQESNVLLNQMMALVQYPLEITNKIAPANSEEIQYTNSEEAVQLYRTAKIAYRCDLRYGFQICAFERLIPEVFKRLYRMGVGNFLMRGVFGNCRETSPIPAFYNSQYRPPTPESSDWQPLEVTYQYPNGNEVQVFSVKKIWNIYHHVWECLFPLPDPHLIGSAEQFFQSLVNTRLTLSQQKLENTEENFNLWEKQLSDKVAQIKIIIYAMRFQVDLVHAIPAIAFPDSKQIAQLFRQEIQNVQTYGVLPDFQSFTAVLQNFSQTLMSIQESIEKNNHSFPEESVIVSDTLGKIDAIRSDLRLWQKNTVIKIPDIQTENHIIPKVTPSDFGLTVALWDPKAWHCDKTENPFVYTCYQRAFPKNIFSCLKSDNQIYCFPKELPWLNVAYAALFETSFAVLPAAMSDTLHLTGLIQRKSAAIVKCIMQLMIFGCLFLLSQQSLSTMALRMLVGYLMYQVARSWGCNHEAASVVNVVISVLMTDRAITKEDMYSTMICYGAGRAGLFAERNVARLIESKQNNKNGEGLRGDFFGFR